MAGLCHKARHKIPSQEVSKDLLEKMKVDSNNHKRQNQNYGSKNESFDKGNLSSLVGHAPER
jgi:hypothetical protein